MLQLTTRGTAQRFQAIAVTAVTELLAKVQLAFRVFHFTHAPLSATEVSNQPQVTSPPTRKV
jgi:hypothetical protein